MVYCVGMKKTTKRPHTKTIGAGEVTDMLSFIVEHMATKDDIASIESRMATKKDIANIESRMATKEDLKDLEERMIFKIDDTKEEIIDRLLPTERALDKDAVTLVNHEHRIARIEKRLAAR